MPEPTEDALRTPTEDAVRTPTEIVAQTIPASDDFPAQATEEPATVNSTIAGDDIYEAIRITDARATAESYSPGDEVLITYQITNVTDSDLEIPLDTSLSPPMHLLGARQCWIERQGDNSTIPAIPTRIFREGNRYAAGGSIIRARSVFRAGESRRFTGRVNTTGYPPGRYTYHIIYKRFGSEEIFDSVKVEFELQVADGQRDGSAGLGEPR